MQVMIDDNAKEVHLLGLDWGDVALIRSSLVDKILKIRHPAVTARAIALIDLTDAGTESVLTANLGVNDVDNL